MDFSSGNSGNTLLPAVVKRGLGCRQEGAFCQHLSSDVAPMVYGLLDDGYVMEGLVPAPRDPYLLLDIEELLKYKVWSRPALPISNDDLWAEDLLKNYDITTPKYPVTGKPCLVHGDPTASNALFRGKQLILGDPRPPRSFIPQCAESDMGRILQSYYGWEVAAYGATEIVFQKPRFLSYPHFFRSAHFWLRAAAVRIARLEASRPKRERTQEILNWCDFIIERRYA